METPDPITEAPTESMTEVARRKFLKLKMEAFGAFLFILGMVSAVDPGALILIFGPDSRGWVMMTFGVVVFLLRRFGTPEPEKFFPKKDRH